MIRPRHILILQLALVSLACQPSTQDDIAAIEGSIYPRLQIEGEAPPPSTIQDRMAHHNVPGVSVAVYRDGKLAWARGYGFADVESESPVTPTTLFQAASISKPIAAMAALDMAEDGLVDIDANINTYLTSWTLAENEFTASEKVTIRRLLNHTAGTTVWGFPGYARDADRPDAVGVVRGAGNTDSIHVYKVPGESWQYSGGGTTVMQIALADVARQPFEAIMAQRVIAPLELGESTYEQPLPEHLHSSAATGYRGDGTAVEGKWHVYPEQAAAGLWTTPTDLGKYAVDIQNGLLRDNSAVLDQATIEEMLTPGLNDQGLGPGIRNNGLYFGHGGANEGFRCDLIASKDGSFAVAVMTNSDRGGALYYELLQAIFAHYGWSGYEPNVRSVTELSADQMSKFAGTYTIADLGELSISTADGKLWLDEGDLVSQRVELRAENDSTLFDVDDGDDLTFTFDDDGVAVSFVVQRFTATRVE